MFRKFLLSLALRSQLGSIFFRPRVRLRLGPTRPMARYERLLVTNALYFVVQQQRSLASEGLELMRQLSTGDLSTGQLIQI
jgi:hypothetical protein